MTYNNISLNNNMLQVNGEIKENKTWQYKITTINLKTITLLQTHSLNNNNITFFKLVRSKDSENVNRTEWNNKIWDKFI